MSDQILGGDFIVYYSADSNRKQIKWNTATTTGNLKRSANELYSALQDLFDELNQLDDGVPMSAQTPTEYTIGAIDASDLVPWFIDDETIQRIYGGAIKTNLWTRKQGTQAGIVKIALSANSAIVYGDIGGSVTVTAGTTLTATGVLLDYRGSGASTVLWIRPTDSTATHDFTGATNITVNNGVAHASGAMTCVVSTGESLWANIYSLGSIATDKNNIAISDLYVYKDGIKVGTAGSSYVSGVNSYQWWPTGHLDILMKVKEAGALAFTATTSASVNVTGLSINAGLLRVGQPIFGSAIPAGTTIAAIVSKTAITLSQAATGASTNIYVNNIDGSYVTVYGREYDNTYDYFTVDLNSGGRNPIPLATGDDLNNHTGTRQLTGSGATNTFAVGEVIYVGTDLASATKKGVITAVTGSPGATPVITYYLIGNLTDFANADAVKGARATANPTCTVNGAPVSNPAATNPAGLTGIVVTTGNGNNTTPIAYSVDINNTNGARPYAVQINANSYTLDKVYEYTKYITRRGNTAVINGTNSNGTNIAGERYIGPDYKITYSGISGGSTFAAGDVVFQLNTNAGADYGKVAIGTVVTHDTSGTFVILRDSRGEFVSGAGTNTITNGTVTIGSTSITPASITPIKACPFGTFAGGKFFGATGVYFTNLNGGDAKNYQLTALDGTTQVPPNSVSIVINKLITGDAVGVYRVDGTNNIIKNRYTAAVTAVNAGTIVCTDGSAVAITGDEPSVGFVRAVLVNASHSGTSVLGKVGDEHRYRYSAVNTGTKTFTLATVTTGQAGVIGTSGAFWNSSTDASAVGGNLIKVVAATISPTEVFVGDMVFTAATGTPGTPIACGSIVKIAGDNQTLWIRVFGTVTIGDWAAGNKLTYNKVAVALTTTDKLYVPFIDTMCTTGSVGSYTSLSNILIYSSDIPTLARVRQYKAIQPFEANPSIGITGVSADAVRTSDSIAT